MKKELVCGIDEAGRGPVIGPLVIGCVVIDSTGREELKKLNVRDSKKVAASRRKSLEPLIKNIAIEWKLIHIKPSEIDHLRKKHSLNAVEAMKIADLILSLKNKSHRIIIDSVDNIPDDYKKRIIKYIKLKNPDYEIPEIISENKADNNYIEVGAASIIAKVERDREIENLKQRHGNFGSGYPADEITKKYIKEMVKNGDFPHFVRRSWNTLNKTKQRKLDEF